MDINSLILRAFASFFAEANLIKGHEKTFHALFCHHLVQSGVPIASVLREARYNGAPVDVVIRGGHQRKLAGQQPSVLAAFEFKGGAYGARNALAGTVGQDGFCADMEKLEWFPQRGLTAWFVCIDIAELGAHCGAEMRRRVAAECATRGIGFAYFCQGEQTYLLAEPGQDLREHSLQELCAPCAFSQVASTLEGVLQSELPKVGMSGVETEDDFTFRVYQAIRAAGYVASQTSLETYFSFARKQSTMALRPDLCIFDAALDGNFNLYRRGRRSDCNDARKLSTLQALIEVKAHTETSRQSVNGFVKGVSEDLQKLALWRSMICDAEAALGICRATEPDLMLLVYAPAASALRPPVLLELNAKAANLGVRLLHFYGAEDDGVRQASHEGVTAPTPRYFKMVRTPTGARELATYMAAILKATGMDQGQVFPLTRFLSNFSTHLDAGRIVRVEGGYRLTQRGMDYFESRFIKSRGGAIDRVEVAEMAQRIQTGGVTGWVAA